MIIKVVIANFIFLKYNSGTINIFYPVVVNDKISKLKLLFYEKLCVQEKN